MIKLLNRRDRLRGVIKQFQAKVTENKMESDKQFRAGNLEQSQIDRYVAIAWAEAQGILLKALQEEEHQ